MKRVPIFATLIVLVAVMTMIALGFWQRDRAIEKEELLARFAENLHAPRLALEAGRDSDANLLRPVSLDCREGSPTRLAGAGRYGFRVIADCARSALGHPIVVQLGTQPRPGDTKPWAGGQVTGYLTHAPDSRAVITQIFDHRPAPLMVVADPPLAGLAANPGPDLSQIPNNHRSYMVQWFAFAGIALLIYGLALRSRWRRT